MYFMMVFQISALFRSLVVPLGIVVCKIPLLLRALVLKAAARPSARTTISYLVYNGYWCSETREAVRAPEFPFAHY